MKFVFNARTIMPNEGGAEKWPDGNYPVIIIGSEGKAIKTGDTTGSRMNFQVLCIDGPMKGKKNFIGLNLEHSNETTKRIAWEHMSAMYWCCGVLDGQQTEDLYFIPFVAYASGSERGNNWNNFKTINGENAIEVYNRVSQGGPIWPNGAPQKINPASLSGGSFGGAPQPGGFAPQPNGPAPAAAPPPTGQWQGQPAAPAASPPAGGGWGAGTGGAAPQGGGFTPPAGFQQGGAAPATPPAAGGGWAAGGAAPTAQPGWTS